VKRLVEIAKDIVKRLVEVVKELVKVKRLVKVVKDLVKEQIRTLKMEKMLVQKNQMMKKWNRNQKAGK